MGISAYALPPANDQLSLDSHAVEASRKVFGGQLTPPPVTRARWHVEDLEDAEISADAGDLTSIGQLWNACRSDGVFVGVLSTRTDGIVGLPKRFRGDGQLVEELRAGGDSVRSVFDEMFPPAELAAIAADGIGVGVGVGELVPVQGRDFPILVRHSPEFLVYRWAENRWYLRTICGLIPINPGDGHWILHIPGGRIAPWRNGLWKACGRAWIEKQHALLYNQSWQAVLAHPARAAVSPNGAPDEVDDAWFQKVLAWGVNTVFGMKPGFDVKLIESNGRGWESFSKSIERSEREFIIALAGQEVTTTGGSGFANADVHKSIRADLIKATADALAYTLNTQGISVWVIARYGEEMLARCPCVEWVVTPPRELAAEAQMLVTLATAITTLRAALLEDGKKLDVADLCVRYGVAIEGDKDGDGVADGGAVVREFRRAA
jgi:phage gp29-like protein